jgi:hypothetical protein
MSTGLGPGPILRKVWTLPGQRPLAPVEHRYAWRYLVAFVHPASGRTVWHLASTVTIELFSVELEAFAQAVGAGPTNQIVLVLDGAGWADRASYCRPPAREGAQLDHAGTTRRRLGQTNRLSRWMWLAMVRIPSGPPQAGSASA